MLVREALVARISSSTTLHLSFEKWNEVTCPREMETTSHTKQKKLLFPKYIHISEVSDIDGDFLGRNEGKQKDFTYRQK